MFELFDENGVTERTMCVCVGNVIGNLNEKFQNMLKLIEMYCKLILMTNNSSSNTVNKSFDTRVEKPILTT